MSRISVQLSHFRTANLEPIWRATASDVQGNVHIEEEGKSQLEAVLRLAERLAIIAIPLEEE